MDRRKFFRSLAVAPVAAKLIALDKLVAEDVIADGIIDLHQMARYMTQRIAKALDAVPLENVEWGFGGVIMQPVASATYGIDLEQMVMSKQAFWSVAVDSFDPDILRSAADEASSGIADRYKDDRIRAVVVPDRVESIENHVRFNTLIRGLAYLAQPKVYV